MGKWLQWSLTAEIFPADGSMQALIPLISCFKVWMQYNRQTITTFAALSAYTGKGNESVLE